MRETWNKTTAFEYFGVPLLNTRWSWSGRSSDSSVVALVLWQDGVKGKNGELTYDDTEDADAEWRSRPGSKERTKILEHCRDYLGGRFRAVIAVAIDVKADPRQIERCFPQKDVFWQLDYFDDKTGAFSAHVIQDVSKVCCP